MNILAKILLTGFEPFDGRNVNPSEQVVKALASQQLDGIKLTTVILPVEQTAGPQALTEVLEDLSFKAILCLGEARSRSMLSLERIAVNLLDYRIEDNTGNQISDKPVEPKGPDAYFTTLPIRAMIESIREAGVPAELSMTAGTFLCNQVAYTLLHHLSKHKRYIPAGFIHLPGLPEQIAQSDQPGHSMALETMIKDIASALITIRDTIIDLPNE